jgi:hypothetical protein
LAGLVKVQSALVRNFYIWGISALIFAMPQPEKSNGCSNPSIRMWENTDDSLHTYFIFLQDDKPLDTLRFTVQDYDQLDYFLEDLMLVDLNFDGHCDVFLTQVLLASHGAIPRRYFLYDPQTQQFNESLSLPRYVQDFKLIYDKKQVVITCPYGDCEAIYHYKNGQFRIFSGEYFVAP